MRRTALVRLLALVIALSCLTLAGLRTHSPSLPTGGGGSGWYFHATTLSRLPEAEFRVVEFLLLLPVAGVVVSLFRNVVGLSSFGTFAPVLIGLAFRDLASWPAMLVFVAVLFVGWGLRRLLEPLHLLEVPRASLLLSLVVAFLVGLVLVCHAYDIPASRCVSLFPLVILTGMIERLWAMETDDGALAALKTLAGTLTIAISVSLVLAIPGLVLGLTAYPELIGLLAAGQLVLGRFTGYRLTELYRFRALLEPRPEANAATPAHRRVELPVLSLPRVHPRHDVEVLPTKRGA